tara:strand:- start:2496 stop:3023 length:528 start_codon:yes stop_codon:yes gene_type:complete
VDEVTFLIRLLSDNWASAASTLVSSGDITSNHNETPNFIDVRSIAPNEGRRVDMDSKSVVIVYEDSGSTEYPTIDYAVRNETFGFTVHIRTMHRRDFSELTFSRDRLQALYRIARYIFENNSLQPKVYVGGNSSNNVEDSAQLIKLQSRSEANDRNKRLLGYKLTVEMKRMAISV